MLNIFIVLKLESSNHLRLVGTFETLNIFFLETFRYSWSCFRGYRRSIVSTRKFSLTRPEPETGDAPEAVTHPTGVIVGILFFFPDILIRARAVIAFFSRKRDLRDVTRNVMCRHVLKTRRRWGNRPSERTLRKRQWFFTRNRSLARAAFRVRWTRDYSSPNDTRRSFRTL